VAPTGTPRIRIPFFRPRAAISVRWRPHASRAGFAQLLPTPAEEIRMNALSKEQAAPLAAAVTGRVVCPDAPEFDELRKVWNGMVDRRPAAIVQCASADDVAPAIAFARGCGLTISVRGGGHHIAGNSIADGG